MTQGGEILLTVSAVLKCLFDPVGPDVVCFTRREQTFPEKLHFKPQQSHPAIGLGERAGRS